MYHIHIVSYFNKNNLSMYLYIILYKYKNVKPCIHNYKLTFEYLFLIKRIHQYIFTFVITITISYSLDDRRNKV